LQRCCSLDRQAVWKSAKQLYEVNTVPRAKVYGKAQPVNPEEKKDIEATLDGLQKLNLIRPSTLDFSCPA